MAVLVSGEGSNLQALLDDPEIDVVCVASNRAEARGLERARAAGLDVGVFPGGGDREARDSELAGWLEQHEVDLVVLAGFMELLGAPFIRRFEGRVVNVHPSLLPAFPGVRPIEQAIDYGVALGGVTVHFVDEGVDSGPVLLQESFELPYPRDIEAIEQRVHEIEHRLLPRAVRLIAAGSVTRDEHNPRIVRIDGDG